MEIKFDDKATNNKEIEALVKKFLNEVDTAEKKRDVPVVVYQDGVKKSYYIRCAISGATMNKVVSLDARLDPESDDTFRDNREVQMTNNTFLRMKLDAENAREFNDIIAEYITSYGHEKPLKIWGGQHRSKAGLALQVELTVAPMARPTALSRPPIPISPPASAPTPAQSRRSRPR